MPPLPKSSCKPGAMPPPVQAGLRPSLLDATSIESNALLRGARELLIRHAGEVYRLRHTRNDKLILTK